jgi:hypothetical protein
MLRSRPELAIKAVKLQYMRINLTLIELSKGRGMMVAEKVEGLNHASLI